MRCTYVFVCDVFCEMACLMCVVVFCGVLVCGCVWFCHVLCAVCDVLCDDVCVVFSLLGWLCVFVCSFNTHVVVCV